MRTFGSTEFLYVLAAVRWTLLLSLVAFVGGIAFGFLIALARISRFAVLRLAASGYIQLFQGTPVLIQLFIAYYGLAVLFNVKIDEWTAVSLTFTLYSAAFLGEIWRGAISGHSTSAVGIGRVHIAELFRANALHHPAASVPDIASTDRRLPGSTRKVDLDCGDHRFRRIDACRTIDDQRDVRADDRVSDRRGALFYDVLAVVPRQPAAGKAI